MKMTDENKFQLSTSMVQLIIMIAVNIVAATAMITKNNANTDELKAQNMELKLELKSQRDKADESDKRITALTGEVIELRTELKFYIANKVK
jgi:hypothetical protein